ncbi:hypothetical protein CPIN17260_1112 [Campylobacter pinnipediorum subsp. pinnipediorum]|nr:hypothetical protein [Campylobacter pinnipediorum]AQW81401.1 hypothetical protein CPIN17260_1112 [Campylobacter pinnipediorum subsp. pinnipediorum]
MSTQDTRSTAQPCGLVLLSKKYKTVDSRFGYDNYCLSSDGLCLAEGLEDSKKYLIDLAQEMNKKFIPLINDIKEDDELEEFLDSHNYEFDSIHYNAVKTSWECDPNDFFFTFSNEEAKQHENKHTKSYMVYLGASPKTKRLVEILLKIGAKDV